MPLQYSDLRFMQSVVFDDSMESGGVISDREIVSGAANNVWPNTSEKERLAGVVKYRKIFINNHNQDGIALENVQIYVHNPTLQGERVVIFAGTQNDTRADLTGTEAVYGGGVLDVAVAAGATRINVTVASRADAVFRDGDLVRVSGPGGGTEFVRLAAQNAVSWNGNRASLTLADTLANTFSSPSLTCVSSCLEVDAIPPAMAIWERYLIPAGSSDLPNDSVIIALSGESA